MNEMMMDRPVRPNALVHGEQGVLGRPLDRIDGPAKVSGTASYAYEQAPGGVLYAAIVGSPRGSGKVRSIDASAATAMPGVVAVIHGDPRMPAGEANSRAMPQMGTDTVFYHGQPVAIVVAEDQETAREAAASVVVHVAPGQERFDPRAQPVDRAPKIGFLPPIEKGDVDAALAAAAIVFDRTYTTPIHFPAAMEPHATTAWWEGDRLTVRSSNQVIGAARNTIAAALKIDPAKVRVLAPYVGGGFGGKTGVGPEAILAAIAAEQTGRPVKVALPRR